MPHAVETFELSEHDGGTELVYLGGARDRLLGAGSAGRANRVTPTWLSIVEGHLADTKSAAEARADARRASQPSAAGGGDRDIAHRTGGDGVGDLGEDVTGALVQALWPSTVPLAW